MFRFLSIAVLIGLMTGVNPSQGPSTGGGTPRAADPRSQHARLCHGERIT